MINLASVIKRFGQETVYLIKKGRTYDPLSATGFSSTESDPVAYTATPVQSESYKLILEEKRQYGEVPIHLYIAGVHPPTINDDIQYRGERYKIKEVFARIKGNYTHIVCVRNQSEGDRTI